MMRARNAQGFSFSRRLSELGCLLDRRAVMLAAEHGCSCPLLQGQGESKPNEQDASERYPHADILEASFGAGQEELDKLGYSSLH
jgi:hypothetical protein